MGQNNGKASGSNHRTKVVYQVTTHGNEGKIYTDLHVTPPLNNGGVVIFTNGAGRSDFDEAHCFLADKFRARGLGYCQMRVNERVSNASSPPVFNTHETSDNRFSFETVGRILIAAAEFLRQEQALRNVKFCLFGSGDGAAAALFAAATDPAEFAAMILSGGRLSTALIHVPKNSVPTLFVLGSRDNIAANTMKTAYAAGNGHKKLVELEGVGHLLREPGALEDMAEESLSWIEQFAS